MRGISGSIHRPHSVRNRLRFWIGKRWVARESAESTPSALSAIKAVSSGTWQSMVLHAWRAYTNCGRDRVDAIPLLESARAVAGQLFPVAMRMQSVVLPDPGARRRSPVYLRRLRCRTCDDAQRACDGHGTCNAAGSPESLLYKGVRSGACDA